MADKGYVTQGWSTLKFQNLEQNWRKIPGVFPRGAGPRRGLAPCLAKSMVGSPSGGPKHHGGSPGVSKTSKSKATDFESTGRVGTGQEVWGGRTPEAANTGS